MTTDSELLPNPFDQRGRITDPTRFVARWNVLSLLFDRIEADRPVLITGVAGIGRSSLLTHVVQSAAVNLEIPTLRSYYLDVSSAPHANSIYETLVGALGDRGDTQAALEVALATTSDPVLVCLDGAERLASAEWGQRLLEALARMARSGTLMLIVAVRGEPPQLSERYATIALGAFAPSEVRLLTEAYLEGYEISFSPAETRQLAALSAGHPAYLQRAAYHLFRFKRNPEVRWIDDYLIEARNRPIPGAPLPPSVFEGADGDADPSRYDDLVEGDIPPARPNLQALPEVPLFLIYLIPLLIGVLLGMLGWIAAGVVVALAGSTAIWWWAKRAAKPE
ncbi:MAG: ATP-binding protein [Roseiflexaceae bacterium]